MKLSILGSKHPKVLSTDHKPVIFVFTQKSNPNHRVCRFQLFLMKFPNLHIICTRGKNLALPDTFSRKVPSELFTYRLECEYAEKTDSDSKQIRTLERFPLYL